MAPEERTATKRFKDRNGNIAAAPPSVSSRRHKSQVLDCSIALMIRDETPVEWRRLQKCVTVTHFHTPCPGNRFSFSHEPMHQTVASQEGARSRRPRRPLHSNAEPNLLIVHRPSYACLCLAEVAQFVAVTQRHVSPKGIMERYLPRNLLAMVISCHRVQPRWEIT